MEGRHKYKLYQISSAWLESKVHKGDKEKDLRLKKVLHQAGIEPAAFCFPGDCSTTFFLLISLVHSAL